MFKSVFSKYFMILVCLLMVALVALGGVQMIFFNNYWVAEKRTQLTENAQMIAHHTVQVTSHGGDANSYVVSNSIRPIIELMADGLDADILLTDKSGQMLIASEATRVAKPTLPMSVIGKIREDYFTVGTMDGFFPDTRYAAATPLVLGDGLTSIGYVIISMPAGGLMAYMQDTLHTYLMSAILVLLVFSLVVYLATYRLVKPLRQMAAVTRSFAQGDFSCRVPVRGKDEVAELATALNSMAVSLSATEDMSRSFVANVSHELKTPMTTISGFIDGILDGTIPKEKQEHYLRIVADEVRRLSRLVKSMLELSRIDNGTVTLKPSTFDLTETLYTTMLSFEQRIDDKHVEVEGLAECDETMVTADFDLIAQVLYNLLDNAVKFVDDHGTLTVNVYRADGRVYCAVRNSGAGLSPEELPRVFERFYKTDRSRSLDKTGVGLGLYIVKTVINLHQGEITVRSVQGEYCEFVFWLPDPADKGSVRSDKSKLSRHGAESTDSKPRKGRKGS